MIIHHRSWGGNNIRHSCRTVKEFINEELMKIDGKENKYFRICTKKEYNGKSNMLLYFQDGKLKSHHSTKVAFDYNDVLDYEIYELYSMNDLKVDNIVSVDYDCLKELKKMLRGKEEKVLTFDLETLGMSEEEKLRHRLNKIFEENRVKDIIESGESIEDDVLAKALRILFKQTGEITKLNNRISELEKIVEQQSQQIKWLGKNK